jgi:hypothetical protein
VNFAPYVYQYPVQGPTIIIDSSFVAAGGNPKRRCAIYCVEVPNQIVVTQSMGFCDIPVVMLDPKIDVNTYFDNADKRPDGFRYLIGRDNHEIIEWYNSLLPEAMRPYQVNEIKAEGPPKTGHWKRGQFIRNFNLEGHWKKEGYVKETTPAEDEPYGWYCIESGKPGKWKAIPLSRMLERDIKSVIDKAKKTQ